MLSIRSITALALALTLCCACSESTTGPDDGTQTPSETPRAGSTYRLHRYQADTTGAEIPGSGDSAVTTLVETGAQHAGQSAVHLFVQGIDTMRLRYEASGDVLYYPPWPATVGAGWITLPIATKGTTTRTLRDTTIDLDGGLSGRNTVTLTVTYVSSEQVTIGSESVEAHEVRLQVVASNPLTPELNLVESTTHTVWYAPKLGFFSRYETASSRQDPFSTIDLPTAVAVVTEYERK
jgi:hypothetical protein